MWFVDETYFCKLEGLTLYSVGVGTVHSYCWCISDPSTMLSLNYKCRKDSTGIPHILEHSVLCGSRKYPLKEPFVELLKGSLHTFLNAFTYPDRTCYPVASTNTKVKLSVRFY